MRPAEVSIELEPTVIELDESIIVKPGFFVKSPNALSSSQSQSSEEIRRLPGSLEDVVRATANLPGVAQAQAGRNDLIVRGGAPSENLFLIDDIEVSNINHFGTQGASGGPLSYIELDFVDRIRFYTGGYGVRYGDRLSSALSIRLREGRTDRIGGKATLSATKFGLNAEGPIGEGGSFLFSARRSYLDFIFKAAGFEFVPEYWDFLLKTTYRPDARNRISFLGISALDNVRLFNDTAEDRYENSRRLSNNQERFVTGASWQHVFPSGSFTASAGNTYVSYEYQQNDSLLNPFFISNSAENETYAKFETLVTASKSTRLSAGVTGRVVRTDGRILLDSFTTSYGEPLNIDNVYDLTGTKTAGYAQFAGSVGSFSATAGVRADYFDLIADQWAFSPRLATSLMLSPRLSLNGSVGRYHQAPSLVWLASNPYNRDLEQIRADHYIAGLEYLLRDDTRISIEAYTKRYADVPASSQQEFLVLSNTGAGFGGSEQNFGSFGLDSLRSDGRGRSYGIEVLVQKKLSESPLYGTLSLSLNRAEYAGIDGIYRDGAYDQRFIGNLTGGYVFNETWELAAKFRVVTGRPYTPFNTDGTQDPSLYHTERLPTDHSLDLRLDRRWFFGGWNLITYIDIQNIYNRKSYQIPRYNARTGEIERRNEIGIFPTLGISAEF
jgi:hypothetical protein